MQFDRREFVLTAGAAALTGCSSDDRSGAPAYLADRAEAYLRDPRRTTLEWFREARFGLFLHYGLYSLLKRGEWVQYRERIPVAEYAKLKNDFTADGFDAEAICEAAVSAGMRYVNLTARHHDGFCLFRTNQSDFTSLDSPARRDLVQELADACEKRALGLCLYYSYALDWKHPYFFSHEASMQGEVAWEAARPDYDAPQPEYLYSEEEEFTRYLKFAHEQLREILHRYRPAVIWLDPIMGYYSRPDLFPIELTYEIIREARPDVLIAFKQGASGDEDFVAPEREPRAHPRGGSVAQAAWEKNKGKKIEICETLQPRAWGYDERDEGRHRGPDDVAAMLEHRRSLDANLLLNSGPLPDGSLPAEDLRTLAEVGRRGLVDSTARTAGRNRAGVVGV